MEQKKILWVVVSISLFFLIIFGSALVLYSPSKYSDTNTQQPKLISSKNIQEKTVDNKNMQTDTDFNNQTDLETYKSGLNTASSNINFTFVAGETNTEQFGTLDVSELTRGNAKTNVQISSSQTNQTSLPPSLSLANGTAIGDVSSTSDQTQTSIEDEQNTKIKQTVIKSEASKSSSISPSTKSTEVSKPKTTVAKTITEYWIQTGSFAGNFNAEKARNILQERYLKAEIFTRDVNGATTYRVRIGPYTNKNEAEYWLGAIKEIADFSNSYISEVKVKQ